MEQKPTSSEEIQQLWGKIKDIHIAMMTTIDTDGSLHSRPMATQQKDFDGNLWFFTQASAPKVQEIKEYEQINLSYSKTSDNLFVSVSGTSQLVRDRAKMAELWNPMYKAWFPGGLDDPEIALLKVDVHSAEYWDAPGSKMVYLFNMARSMVTGKSPEGQIGEDVKIKVD